MDNASIYHLEVPERSKKFSTSDYMPKSENRKDNVYYQSGELTNYRFKHNCNTTSDGYDQSVDPTSNGYDQYHDPTSYGYDQSGDSKSCEYDLNGDSKGYGYDQSEDLKAYNYVQYGDSRSYKYDKNGDPASYTDDQSGDIASHEYHESGDFNVVEPAQITLKQRSESMPSNTLAVLISVISIFFFFTIGIPAFLIAIKANSSGDPKRARNTISLAKEMALAAILIGTGFGFGIWSINMP